MVDTQAPNNPLSQPHLFGLNKIEETIDEGEEIDLSNLHKPPSQNIVNQKKSGGPSKLSIYLKTRGSRELTEMEKEMMVYVENL